MDKKYKYLYIVSVLMLLSGAALAMTRHTAFDVLYTVLEALMRAMAPRLVRRVARMGVFSGLLFTLSGVARFGLFDAYGQNAWLVFLVLGLVYMCYGNILLYIGDKKSKQQ